MTRKEFLYKYKNLKISERYWDYGPGILVQVYDTSIEPYNLVFEHFISKFDLDNLKVDYETIVMTPIITWCKETKYEKM